CTEVSIYEPQNNWLVTPDDGNQLEIRVTDYNTHLPQFTGLKFQYRPLLPLPNRVESGDQEASLRSVDPAERSTGSVSKGQSNVEKSIALAQKGLNRPEELGDLRSNDWINMATVRDNNGNTYTGGIIPKDSLNAGYDIFFWRFTEAEVPDGAYEIRVVSQCTGDAPDGSSAILKGVITRHSPQVFGLPEPADQVLDRGDLISIWFDKPIVCDESQLEPQENIKITDTVTDEVIRPPQLEWTCYENQLILNIPMANNSAYENHVLRAEVGNNFGVNPPTGIQDYYGNVGIWNPVTEQADSVVTWEFLVNRNPVFWDNTVVNAVLYEGEGLTIERELINIGAYAVDFELTSPMLASLGLYISPLSGTLQPGSQQTITMVIPPEVTFGVYENTLTAETALGDEPLNIRLQVLCHEPDFSFDPYQYQYSMGITAVVDIDGTRSTDIYDRVVAFVGDDIRGLGSVQYFPTLPEENRYQVALTVFSSSSSGETVSFHVWDASTCSELGQVLETYTFETDRVFGTPTAPDTLRATNQFVKIIPLHQGWTWFSLNVANDDMSVNTLLNSLTPTSNDEIKSHSSFSRYFGDDDTEWAGSLSSLSNDKMYMIKLAQADTLEVIGYAIDPDTTQINLAAGWNWISYTPAFPLPINNALAPISNAVSGDLIKSQLSYAQYVESLGWIGSLVFMESDFGYRVKVQNAQNFTYPSGQVARFDAPLVEIRTRSAEELPPTWQVDPNRFEASMTITHTLHQDQLEITNQVQAIAAFVDDACRGVAYPSYIPALDETRFFLLVHGDVKSTQAVTFRALTDETLLESPEKVPFMADAMLGTVDLPYRIELNRGKLQVETDIPTHYHLSQNHPNPFNPRTTIRYALPQQSTIDLAIYDVQGKRVATLVNADQPAGYYDVLWEGLDDQQQPVASGIYFYRIHAGDFEQTRQLVLLR
ncbi:MAG: T9SS C-terminal target domain-containing protein, partial [Gemmatimonadetes bacterium]